VARLTEHRVSAVPVVNDAELVLGVVSEADLLLKEEHPDLDADLRRLRRSPAT
jgi:CBS domain-containing protein